MPSATWVAGLDAESADRIDEIISAATAVDETAPVSEQVVLSLRANSVARHAVVSAERAGRILNLQGVRMQRPSWMHVRVELAGSAVAGVRVGGAAVLVAEGTLHGRGTI